MVRSVAVGSLVLTALAAFPPGARGQAGGAAGSMVGRVTDAGGVPVPDVRVTALSTGKEDTTGTDGRFRFYGAPEGVHRLALTHPEFGTDTVRVVVAGESTTGVVVSYRSDGTPERTLHLGELPEALAEAGRSASAASREGARIVGRLVDRRTEEAIASAVVEVGGTDRQRQTSENGSFVFESVPPGEYDLRIHHVRYGDRTSRLEVPAERAVNVTIRLAPRALEVEPVRVTVEPRAPSLADAEFYQRRRRAEKLGWGEFLTEEDIEARGSELSHVVGSIPGLSANRGFIYFQEYRMGIDGTCPPTVYLDGHKVDVHSPSGLNSLAVPAEIAGIEAYDSPASTPGRWVDSDSRCGVIAIWTEFG